MTRLFNLRGLPAALFILFVLGVLLAFYVVLAGRWGEAALTVNLRWSRADPRVFVTPDDPSVQATARAVVYGNINPVRDEDLRFYLRLLFDWVSVNIRVRPDSLYPILPPAPGGPISFVSEVWQFPNETLALRSGDCEDAAVLLLSMVRFYAPRLKAACIIVEGDRGGHMAVVVSKGSGMIAVLDPGLYYCTKDEAGKVAFKPLAYEVTNWLRLVEQRIGLGAKVTMLFNDGVAETFRSTNEFIAFFLLKFDANHSGGAVG